MLKQHVLCYILTKTLKKANLILNNSHCSFWKQQRRSPMNTKKLLTALIKTPSPSGYESLARKFWAKEMIRYGADRVWNDVIGNCYALLDTGHPECVVMLDAHIDTLGMQISHVENSGLARFTLIGGWNLNTLVGQPVTVYSNTGSYNGVVGCEAVHLQELELRKKSFELKDLWIDIGAANQKEFLELVEIGDFAVTNVPLRKLQNGLVLANHLDDKAGVATISSAFHKLVKIRKQLKCNVVAVAASQEEIGTRGAEVAVKTLRPSVAIAVDVSFATDTPVSGPRIPRFGKIKLGDGPVVTRGPNINEKLFRMFREQDVKQQVCALPGPTGTDARTIQLANTGVPVELISIPLRSMHSPCEVIHMGDVHDAAEIIYKVVSGLSKDSNFILD